MKIAVQLYTLRNELADNFRDVLQRVATIGYEAVEFAGFYGYKAEEMKALLDELELSTVGSHTSMDELEYHFEDVVRYNKTLGNKNIVIPYTTMATYEEVVAIGRRLSQYEQRLREEGLVLHYHNHAHELAKHNDDYVLDLLFDAVPHLKAEIDTHWVSRAGLDPVNYMKKHQERMTLVHLKDKVVIDGKETFAPLGEGSMDLKAIVEAAKQLGVEALIVENDEPRNGGIADITTSFNYLNSII